MLDLEVRMRVVEERAMEHSQLLVDMRQGLLQFEARVDRRFELVEGRLAALDQKIDTGLAALNHTIDYRSSALDQKIETLAGEMTKHFRWTAGLMLTGLVAIVAAILAT